MKIISNNYLRVFIVITIVTICFIKIYSYHSSYKYRIIETIKNNSSNILDACKLHDINARVYVSVVYGELINNLDEFDNFDETRAKIGLNPSVGFSQMRISTGLWIENHYDNYEGIKKSKDRDELVNKLLDERTNIDYSVLYVKLISNQIEQQTMYPCVIKSIGSYYAKGIDRDSIIIDTGYSNNVGISAMTFYESQEFIDLFPRNLEMGHRKQ
jgi:hypothetical protein